MILSTLGDPDYERDHLTKTRQELGLIAETMARLETEIARL
jgi:hypothetical protein